MHDQTKLLNIISELQAIAQAGITFAKDKFDHERYNRLIEIGANLASLYSSRSLEEISEIFSEDIGYITPKVGIRAAIFESNKILLVKEKIDGLYSLPGGWADINISPKDNILKEIKEETGYECEVIKLIGVYDRRSSSIKSKWPHIYNLFFMCKIIGGEVIQDTLETSNPSFFFRDNLPPLSTGRVTYAQIDKCFAHYFSQALPTEFD